MNLSVNRDEPEKSPTNIFICFSFILVHCDHHEQKKWRSPSGGGGGGDDISIIVLDRFCVTNTNKSFYFISKSCSLRHFVISNG